MIKLLVVLIFMAVIVLAIYLLFDIIRDNLTSGGKVYWCACGCKRQFRASAGWDGFHGPDFDNRYIPEKEKPKAIDYSPESVLGWEDIQWNVEKRLPKEK